MVLKEKIGMGRGVPDKLKTKKGRRSKFDIRQVRNFRLNRIKRTLCNNKK